MEPKQNDFEMLLLALKKILKARRINYRDLSELLNIPESTLKKWFSGKDGSFNRINRICEVLEIRLSDLIKVTEKQSPKTLNFSEAQQRAFMLDRDVFNFFWYLVYERMSVEDIRKRFKLSENRASRLLYQLDTLNLIVLHSSGKVKIPRLRYVKWTPKGIFMERLFREWSDKLIQDALKGKHNEELVLQYFQLTPESASDLIKRIRDLEDEFALRTLREVSLYSTATVKIRCLIAAAKDSFVSSIM